MTDHMTKALSELAKDIIDDGIVDAEEVIKIKERVYADGVVDREEADFLFEINDAVSGAANDPGWKELFVQALTDHVLQDEVSPGELDEDEAKYLIEKIEGDGKIDDVELALLENILSKADKVTDGFRAFVSSAKK